MLVGCLLHYDKNSSIGAQGDFAVMLRTAQLGLLFVYICIYTITTLLLYEYNTTYHHQSALFSAK